MPVVIEWSRWYPVDLRVGLSAKTKILGFDDFVALALSAKMPRSRTMERVGSESGTGRRTSAWWQNEVLLAGVAVIVYLNSLSGDLVFDDLQAIKENPDVR